MKRPGLCGFNNCTSLDSECLGCKAHPEVAEVDFRRLITCFSSNHQSLSDVLAHCFGVRMSWPLMSSKGHQRHGSGRLQSQLASRRSIKKNRQSGENFPGSESTRDFFSNTTIWSDGSKPGERKRVKAYLTASKIVALLRKTTVIRVEFESTFGGSRFWTVKQTPNLLLTGKLPSEAGD